MARSFMKAKPADRKKLLKDAQTAADAVDTSDNPDAAGYVEYYIKTMQRVLDKGDSYIEQVRWCRLMQRGSLQAWGMLGGGAVYLGMLAGCMQPVKCSVALKNVGAHSRAYCISMMCSILPHLCDHLHGCLPAETGRCSF